MHWPMTEGQVLHRDKEQVVLEDPVVLPDGPHDRQQLGGEFAGGVLARDAGLARENGQVPYSVGGAVARGGSSSRPHTTGTRPPSATSSTA